ncbi:MAG: Crp/Fnr family transcriptional regulator [Peptococcaceae bacterium]|nr:Crp/Fnr family transcriptional regulator [Peptococcaceae bacterium]
MSAVQNDNNPGYRVILDQPEVAAILEEGTVVRYPKGQIIFSADEVADRTYYIEDGYVKIYRLGFDGREITVGSIRNPGELMGVSETLYHGKRTCFARAIADVKLVLLSREQFDSVLQKHPELAVKVASLLAARMRYAESMLHSIVSGRVSARMAVTLLNIGRQCGETTREGIKIKFGLTQEELASMSGLSRQTVSTVLKNLKRENLIKINGRQIIIIDPQKLEQIAV